MKTKFNSPFYTKGKYSNENQKRRKEFLNVKTHLALEERAGKFGDKFLIEGEYDWGELNGREEW